MIWYILDMFLYAIHVQIMRIINRPWTCGTTIKSYHSTRINVQISYVGNNGWFLMINALLV